MTYLGRRSATGFLNPGNPLGAGNWSVRFTPADLYPADFVIYHAVLTGPGGSFRVFIDDAFYSVAPRGDINEYDPVNAMYVRRGESILFHWTIATGAAPAVTIYARTPGEFLT